MVYIGRVYRNENFGTLGTIDVMLFQKYKVIGTSRKWSKPLNEISSEINDALGSSTYGDGGGDGLTVKCMIMSGNCSENDMGQFQLPQIGSLGLVMELDTVDLYGNIRYIWLGGLYGNKMYGSEVNLPSDDTDNELDDISEPVDSDDIKTSDYVNNGQYIVKTKTCTINDYDDISSDSLNYENIIPDNTFVLNKNKAALKHNITDDNKVTGIETIKLKEDGIEIKRVYNDSGEQTNIINETSDGITISYDNKKNNKAGSIVISNDGTITVKASGDLNATVGKNSTINVSGNAKIKANGTMDIESGGQMSIKANGVSLGKIINDLNVAVQYLQTYGNPSMQTTMVTSQIKLMSINSRFLRGYKTV